MCVFYQKSFGLSITFLALEYIVAECWTSPAITMLINCLSPEAKATGVSVYLMILTASGTISTAVLGILNGKYDTENHPERYGYILGLFVIIPYMLSLPCFYVAGRYYKSFKEKEDKENEELERGLLEDHDESRN
jgi:hypothetical protein